MDTNVLIYSISTRPDESPKRARALEALSLPDLVFSMQVLQEFYAQATRPSRPAHISHGLAVMLITGWRRFPVVAVTDEVFDRALALCAAYRLSYWDSAIIAAAALSGCAEILTEDLQHGTTIAGVRIRNPFL